MEFPHDEKWTTGQKLFVGIAQLTVLAGAFALSETIANSVKQGGFTWWAYPAFALLCVVALAVGHRFFPVRNV